jgi:hypothetical protein
MMVGRTRGKAVAQQAIGCQGRRLLLAALGALLSGSMDSPAFARNAYTQDARSCDLDQLTRLSDLCPNGFGLPSYGGTDAMIARNPNIAGMIVQAAHEYGVDSRLALAVSAHEGAMSACAGSPTGVQGPMQLTIATGRGYGMDRGLLADNIRGGMLTLRDAVRSCGGSSNIRCLADRYNGSTEAERRAWTNGVGQRLDGLRQPGQQVPDACNGQPQCIMGPGDFPGTRVPVASSPPLPSPTDVMVGPGEV